MKNSPRGINPVRILMITSGYPPDYSGSGKRLHETYVRLKSAHCSLFWRVLTRLHDDRVQRGKPSGPEAIVYFSKPMFTSAWWAPIQTFLEWIEARERIKSGLLSDVDVVHCAGFTWLTVFVCSKARRLGIPVIRELTSVGDTGAWKGIGGRWLAAFVRKLNKSASVLVAISPRLKDEVRATSVKTPIWCRPNPVDLTQFYLPDVKDLTQRRAVLRQQLGWDNEAIVVLHVGHFRPNKNQLLLVQAMTKLALKYHLVLIGPISDVSRSYLEKIKHEIKLNNLESRTHLKTSFQTDIASYMWASDVLAFPSRNEGLGNVMLEALATGLPIAATRISGVTDWIIEPGKNGDLFDLTPEDVAKRIENSAALKSRRDQIATEAARRFDSKGIDGAYWELLKSLATGSEEEGLLIKSSGS